MNLRLKDFFLIGTVILLFGIAMRILFFSSDEYIPPVDDHRNAGGLLARHPALLETALQPVVVLIPDRGDTPSSVHQAIIHEFLRGAKQEDLSLHTLSIPYGQDRQMSGLFTGLRSGELEEALSIPGVNPGAVVSLLGPPNRGITPPKHLNVFAICNTESEARAALADGRLTGAVVDVRTPGLDPRVRNYQILP